MKLGDLKADLDQVTKILAERHNTEVSSTISLNPDNVNELILTLKVSTTTRPAKTEEAAKIPEVVNAAPEDAVPAKVKRQRVKKAADEAQG